MNTRMSLRRRLFQDEKTSPQKEESIKTPKKRKIRKKKNNSRKMSEKDVFEIFCDFISAINKSEISDKEANSHNRILLDHMDSEKEENRDLNEQSNIPKELLPLDLGFLRDKKGVSELITLVKNGNFRNFVNYGFIEKAKNFVLEDVISLAKSLSTQNSPETEENNSSNLNSNCLHVNICYFIWSKLNPNCEDPVDLAQNFKKILLKQ